MLITNDNDYELVTWEEKYSMGIELIDNQHKELVVMINELYQACRTGYQTIDAAFIKTVRHMVEYVRLHFDAEEKLMVKFTYPRYLQHKRQHEEMIKLVLNTISKYKIGRKFVPNNFVRNLKDWVFSHIALHDKDFAVFIADQKEKGLITDIDLKLDD
jgi:hemerythrin